MSDRDEFSLTKPDVYETIAEATAEELEEIQAAIERRWKELESDVQP